MSSKLTHRYLLPKNVGAYNTTQIRNVVHCDQAVEILRFKDEGWIPFRKLAWLGVFFVILFFSLEMGWLNFLAPLFR